MSPQAQRQRRTQRITPWSVWWADFDPRVGHEQAGRRPAIVVSTRLGCELPNGVVAVVPTTTRDRGLPTQPAVSLAGTRCFAMTDQVKSISVDRIVRPHDATLTGDEREAIRFALRQLIDL